MIEKLTANNLILEKINELSKRIEAIELIHEVAPQAEVNKDKDCFLKWYLPKSADLALLVQQKKIDMIGLMQLAFIEGSKTKL